MVSRLSDVVLLEGSFIEHYLLSIVYPPGLTPTVQVILAAALIAVVSLSYPGLFMTCLLRLISPKIPASHSSTMRCIACGARFWAFRADFASSRQFMNDAG